MYMKLLLIATFGGLVEEHLLSRGLGMLGNFLIFSLSICPAQLLFRLLLELPSNPVDNRNFLVPTIMSAKAFLRPHAHGSTCSDVWIMMMLMQHSNSTRKDRTVRSRVRTVLLRCRRPRQQQESRRRSWCPETPAAATARNRVRPSTRGQRPCKPAATCHSPI